MATGRPPRNKLALVVDGKVLSAPAVNQSITGGAVQISGGFTQREAEELVRQMTGAKS